MILGLDISTACTGWCILSEEGQLIDIGYFNLRSFSGLYEKSEEVKKCLDVLSKRFSIKKIFIEENLQAFRPGFSSAKTIVTLARFNGVVSYLSSQAFDLRPEYINVNVARKTVGLKIVPKRHGGDPTKDQVFDWVSNRVDQDWPTKVMKSGPRKGQTVLEDVRYDMADAYVICLAGIAK
jgi:hypothetical protein